MDESESQKHTVVLKMEGVDAHLASLMQAYLCLMGVEAGLLTVQNTLANKQLPKMASKAGRIADEVKDLMVAVDRAREMSGEPSLHEMAAESEEDDP